MDRILSGNNIVAWRGTFSSLLQLQAILCLELPGGMQCFMQRVGFMPKQRFAERVLTHFMEQLSEIPFDSLGATCLAANMLWSGMIERRFDLGGFIGLDCQGIAQSIDNYCRGYLLIPHDEDLRQFSVKVIPQRSGVYHAYMNAVHDLLHQPCFELWGERPALAVKLLP